MAGFFKSFFRGSQPPGRSSYEDTFQEITDNQPQNSFKEVVLLEGHMASVKHLLQVNHSCFLSAGDDACVIIWNSETGSLLHVFKAHTAPVTALLLLRDQQRCLGQQEEEEDSCLILSASRNELIYWELNTSDERFDPESDIKITKEHDGAINCITLLRHGMVCSGGEDLCLWDLPSGKLLSKFNWSESERDKGEIFSVLEFEGRSFGVIAVSNCNAPAVFDIKKSTLNQNVTYQLVFCRHILSFHHSPISFLAPISSTLFVTGALDGTVIIWSSNSFSAVKRFDCLEDEGYEITVSLPSPSSVKPTQPGMFPVTFIMSLCEKYMFVATGNGFKVFDIYSSEGGSQTFTDTPKVPKPIMVHSNAHKETITHMEFLQDKCMLLTSSKDGSVRLWGSRPPVTTPSLTPPLSDMKAAVELFLGMSPTRSNSIIGRRRSLSHATPIVPLLVGELCLHTDSVQNVMYLGAEHGIVTAGSDNYVLLWKDSELQTQERDEEIQKHLRGEIFYDAAQ